MTPNPYTYSSSERRDAWQRGYDGRFFQSSNYAFQRAYEEGKVARRHDDDEFSLSTSIASSAPAYEPVPTYDPPAPMPAYDPPAPAPEPFSSGGGGDFSGGGASGDW
jgi:hypothetical protein